MATHCDLAIYLLLPPFTNGYSKTDLQIGCMFSVQSKLTAAARGLVRSCRAEMGEIEACPECYAAAHARRPTWFTDVCSTPHILLWAKLKGKYGVLRFLGYCKLEMKLIFWILIDFH